MAGAGYKLFNTGDVLTAAQVNTYLMEQTVMVFANAAARTTALSGVVSEGMISYLKDTNAVEVYDGSNWVSSDDPNAIQNTIVDAKGDLIAASAADTPARLAVGANDLVLTAASGETTGLKWSGGWTTYTPSWTGLTVGNGTVTARYAQIGKIVTVMVRLVFGSTTSVTGGFVQVTVPLTSNVSSGGIGQAYFLDSGTADYPGIVKQDSSTVFSINPISSDGTYAAVKSMTSTVPFTWTTNDVVNFVVTYEAV